MRFSFKILLTCLLAGILPAIAVVVAIYFVTSSVYVEMTNHSLSSFKNGSDYIIQTSLDEVARQAGALPQRATFIKIVSEKNAADFEAFVRPLMEAGGLDYIVVYDSDDQPFLTALSNNIDPAIVDSAAILRGAVMDTAVNATTVPGKIDVKYAADILDGENSNLGRLVAGSLVFTEKFLDEMKAMFGVEFTVFRDDTRSMTTLVNNGQRVIGTKMTNPTVLDLVLKQGRVFQDKNVILGNNYDTVYWPVKDGAGSIIGMYFLGMPATIVERTQRNFFITTGILILVTVVLVFIGASLVSRSMGRTLNHVMESMKQSLGLVATAVKDLKSSSDSLAQGVSIQASSLEESSAALEEISSMVNQTAENSSKTNTETQMVEKEISEGSSLVTEMSTAMTEISESAEKIGAIIKTIEGIAFQTNLLALNASVEAARAGEAGAGFAVVADEVRNLAQRSTQAAGDTNSLIGGTVTRVANGVRISGLLSQSFEKIRHGSGEVSHLIEGIAVASKEQFQGLDQVNQAVGELNKVAGSNSESSEAAAAASRELSEAAEALEGVMAELSLMVTGRAD